MTHDVDDLRESKANLDDEGVGGVTDRPNQLVVLAFLPQQHVVQPLRLVAARTVTQAAHDDDVHA